MGRVAELGSLGGFTRTATTTMNTQKTTLGLTLCALVAVLAVGCSSVPIPSAKRYKVRVGATEYQAESVRIHGQWIEIGFGGKSSSWVHSAGVVITPIPD